MSTAEPFKVRFANGEQSTGLLAGLKKIIPWQAFGKFIVLSLVFQIIFVMPWLV